MFELRACYETYITFNNSESYLLATLGIVICFSLMKSPFLSAEADHDADKGILILFSTLTIWHQIEIDDGSLRPHRGPA